jgi:non-ribosomal peptide synthetase component F
LYRALVAGRRTVLPEPELRFADIAVWERDRLQSDAYRLQLEYWSRQLAGPLPMLALPVDHDGPIDGPAQGARKSVLVTAAAAGRFRDTCHRHSATLFMGYLAAWQALLHWWCGQDDVIVGVPAGYREHRQTTEVVGFLVNSVAIRTRFAGCTTFTDVLTQVRDTAIASYANQDVPFDRIVEELRPTRRMSDSAPIFRAWFVLHDVPKPPWDLPGVTATPLDAHFLLAVHDIKLSLVEKEGGIEGGIDYRTALFDPPTIARLSRCFIALIEQIAGTPNITLTELTRALNALEERNRGLAGPEPSARAAWPSVKAGRVLIRSQIDGS